MKIASLCLMFFFTFPVFAEDSAAAKEAGLLLSEIDRQSAAISIEYTKNHVPVDGIYKSIWNEEFSISQYLELATHIIDTTNSIQNDHQDRNAKFRLWRSLFILSKRCQWSLLNLTQSSERITQSGIKTAVSKQVENAKAGCDEIDSKLIKYRYDFPEHQNKAEGEIINRQYYKLPSSFE